ncbi:hypothetical protein GOB57_25225 [Sinorhizobium meliloti]|nr:hypothetical protein [Sinorhizobium meliloti]
MITRTLVLSSCLASMMSVAAPSLGLAAEEPPYLAVGIPTGDDADFGGVLSVGERRKAEVELRLLLDEISELEFDDYCDFNGFPASGTSYRRYDYPCVAASAYRAVRVDGHVKLFKQDGKRMIEMKTVVGHLRERRQLLDFHDVRRAFDLSATTD